MSLLEQASATEPGLAAAVGDLVKQVRKLGKIDLQKDLLPSLGGEAAIALQPAADEGGGGGDAATGTLPGLQIPFLEFIAADVDSDRAEPGAGPPSGSNHPGAQSLARSFRLPSFASARSATLTAYSVQPLAHRRPHLRDRGLDPGGRDRPRRGGAAGSGEGGLAAEELFDRATDGFPGELSVLGYLNLGGLITLAESAGLGEDPAYATFASDIQRLQALGVGDPVEPGGALH